MVYLFFQTWAWILASALIGLVTGWLIWGRNAGASAREIQFRLRQLRKKSMEIEPGVHDLEKGPEEEYPRNTVLHAKDL